MLVICLFKSVPTPFFILELLYECKRLMCSDFLSVSWEFGDAGQGGWGWVVVCLFFYFAACAHKSLPVLPLFGQSSVLVVLLDEGGITDSIAWQYHRQADALVNIHSTVAGSAASEDLTSMSIVP